MKSLYLTFLSALSVVSLIAPEATAQSVYSIESGVTSISLSKPAFASLGFTITGMMDTVTPAAGYDTGLEISTTTKAKDRFCFTLDPFLPGEGIIEHTGTIQFEGGISIGNFEVAFDSSRVGVANSGFFITDRADLAGEILFDIGSSAADTIDATEFTIGDSDLLVAPEFASFLGSGGFAGTDVGDFRVDALVQLKTVPEPSTALLTLVGGIFLVFRRKRA
jgi:hypothetical protein